MRLTSVDLGIDYRQVLSVGLVPRGSRPSAAERATAAARMAALVRDVLPIIRALPNIEHVSAISGTVPLQNGHDRSNVTVPGHPGEFESADDAVDVYRATRDYPVVLNVSLVRGRLFRDNEEMVSTAPVVLLNETAAARFFPGTEALGQTIGLYGTRTVVGILHSVRAGGPESDVRPEAYLPFSHDDSPFAFLVMKTRGDRRRRPRR